MILTPRDRALLLDLNEYALHRTRTLRERHFPGVAMTTVLRRLRILESEGYIQRIEGLPNAQVAWSLTGKTAELLQPKASKIHFPRFVLDHDLGLADLRLALEGHGIARSWTPEHEIRSRVAKAHGMRRVADRNVPDALMGIQTGGQQHVVAVELELTAKNQRRYRRILDDYGTKQSLWGIWYVVPRRTIAKQVLHAANDIAHAKPFLMWSILEDVMRSPLESIVHGVKAKYRLRDLWTPAHTGAQSVSTPNETAKAS